MGFDDKVDNKGEELKGRAKEAAGAVTGDDELGRHTGFREELRQRGERYVLGVPCTTTMRDLEAPLPAYQGRGRRPKSPWQSVTAWRQGLDAEAWTRLTVPIGDCDMKSFQSLLCLTLCHDTTRCPISGILRRCAGR